MSCHQFTCAAIATAAEMQPWLILAGVIAVGGLACAIVKSWRDAA